MTSQISVHLSEELNAMLSEYTNRKGLTKAEFIRGVLAEKLEDEDDILIADKLFRAFDLKQFDLVRVLIVALEE